MSIDYVLLTRKYFIDNCNACIEDATNGEFKVNDLDSYVKWQKDRIVDINEGKSDHTFTFLQYKHYLETGECVPLLPK